jgi:hypothetical protein
MSQKPSKQFNSRKFQGQMERELIIGGIAVGLVVGGGLIYLFWGISALMTSLTCVVSFGGLILVVWLFLKVIEIVSRD